MRVIIRQGWENAVVYEGTTMVFKDGNDMELSDKDSRLFSR